ncbi:hypothetical protein [Rhizobium leguminosarum]|uniref:hypothetical protein n=1 Tax=Rhizobium leguminosarum TaxID=384 RepID=UPI003F95D2DE
MSCAKLLASNPRTFGGILRSEIRKNGDTIKGLCLALKEAGAPVSVSQFGLWCRDERLPTKVRSHKALHAIEARYGLPHGYFIRKLSSTAGLVSCYAIKDVPHNRLELYAWHLPDNFLELSAQKQAEIKAWVNRNIFYNTTAFRKYQSQAVREAFGINYLQSKRRRLPLHGDVSTEAPVHLKEEVNALISFKTATLPPEGMDRLGRWSASTAHQKNVYLNLFFGALISSPDSRVAGFGARAEDVTIALLVFPAVWDWYLAWREKRRGFFTAWETGMMIFAKSLSLRQTGWLRQNGWLSSRLKPIAGLISETDVERAQNDWDAVCDVMQLHAQRRSRALASVEQVHRDPFEAIEPILNAKSPIQEYRKITKQIIAHLGRGGLEEYEQAEGIRAFLMLQFGMHLGLRQKNLRELLVCRSDCPTPEAVLAQKRRGELKWSSATEKWEVLVPAVAFKNASSPFFYRAKPYLCVIPDVDDLYAIIAAYMEKHRSVLIGDRDDPETFFVKGNLKKKGRPDFDRGSFYDAWRSAIVKFGIYNPYTNRGAIKGLLPHGPHCVRDVLATHVLKTTGSVELAGHAIQDTPQMVAQFYGRFLPSEKTALVIEAIKDAWKD